MLFEEVFHALRKDGQLARRERRALQTVQSCQNVQADPSPACGRGTVNTADAWWVRVVAYAV